MIITISILPERPWQSCAIFCQRNDREGFYSPRFELNSLPEVSAHFPDGTWCGNDGQKDLYCLHRSCASTEVAEGLVRSSGKSYDLDMANNAPMTGKVHHKIPAALEVGSFHLCLIWRHSTDVSFAKGILYAGQGRQTSERRNRWGNCQSRRRKPKQPFRLWRSRFHHFETTKVKDLNGKGEQ